MGATYAGLALIIGGGYLTGQGPAGGLKPKTPITPPPPKMPSIAEQQQEQQLVEAQSAAARYGRNATVLTSNADTGDKLGP